MSRDTCREEGANARDDGKQGENDRNAIAVRHIVNADSGCLAYPSAGVGYREDCADNGASRQVGALKCAGRTTPRSAMGLPRLPKGVGEACQSVQMVKCVHYSIRKDSTPRHYTILGSGPLSRTRKICVRSKESPSFANRSKNLATEGCLTVQKWLGFASANMAICACIVRLTAGKAHLKHRFTFPNDFNQTPSSMNLIGSMPQSLGVS